MKTSELVSDATAKTLTRLNSEKMPARAGFAVMLNIKSLEEVLKAFNAKRGELVDRYTLKDVDKQVIHPLVDGKPDQTRVTITDVAAFSKELDDLLSVEVDIKVVKLTPEQFGDVYVSPEELRAISWMLAE